MRARHSGSQGRRESLRGTKGSARCLPRHPAGHIGDNTSRDIMRRVGQDKQRYDQPRSSSSRGYATLDIATSPIAPFVAALEIALFCPDGLSCGSDPGDVDEIFVMLQMPDTLSSMSLRTKSASALWRRPSSCQYLYLCSSKASGLHLES